MHYLRFIIHKYRAIKDDITVDVSRSQLMPIIGVNECGKTTILHAIFAFDFMNDQLNEDGRHLKDTDNLFSTANESSSVSAEVEMTSREIKECARSAANGARRRQKIEDANLEKKIAAAADSADELARLMQIRRLKELRARTLDAALTKLANSRSVADQVIRITRELENRTYSIAIPRLDAGAQNLLGREIISNLPYILYFDDFRDSIDDRLEIPKGDDEPTGWLAVIEQLFTTTNEDFSILTLRKLEDRKRKTVLASVSKRLNDTLTRQWQHFRLDEQDALKISLNYEENEDKSRGYIRLDVIESKDGQDYYFNLRDRSKGFFWFFNFVMKLEFNPKIAGSSDLSIYLLDEPGSYLHASAQQKLAAKLLALSQKNVVIYCTHSHYLLDPEVIPTSRIRIADRGNSRGINLIPIYEHKDDLFKGLAFQPLIDALQIKPFSVDLTVDNVVLCEGIIDYYAFMMLRSKNDPAFLPARGATTISHYIPFFVCWNKNFFALWDNDEEGNRELSRATDTFGTALANSSFRLLPKVTSKKKTVLQTLFSGPDLEMARQALQLPTNATFDRTITQLFYSPKRVDIVSKFSTETRMRFDGVMKLFK